MFNGENCLIIIIIHLLIHSGIFKQGNEIIQDIFQA